MQVAIFDSRPVETLQKVSDASEYTLRCCRSSSRMEGISIKVMHTVQSGSLIAGLFGSKGAQVVVVACKYMKNGDFICGQNLLENCGMPAAYGRSVDNPLFSTGLSTENRDYLPPLVRAAIPKGLIFLIFMVRRSER